MGVRCKGSCGRASNDTLEFESSFLWPNWHSLKTFLDIMYYVDCYYGTNGVLTRKDVVLDAFGDDYGRQTSHVIWTANLNKIALETPVSKCASLAVMHTGDRPNYIHVLQF